MKLSLAVLALITPTEACLGKDIAHWFKGHHGHHPHPPRPLPEFHCNYDASGDMKHDEFLIAMHRTVYTSFVEGMYGVDSTQFSDKCFSEADLPVMQRFHAFKHKIIEGDYMNVSIPEAVSVANDLIEMIWSNVDECKMMVPITDAISWCGDNSDKCVHKVGLLDRINDNFFTIAKMLWDIFHVAKRETLCENQTQKLDNIGLTVQRVASLWALYDGFDMGYNPEKELPKESLKVQYHNAKQKVYDNWPEKKHCPFRPLFDAIHEAKKEIAHRFEEQMLAMPEPHFQHRSFANMTPAMPHMNMQQYTFHMPPQPVQFMKEINAAVPHYKMPQVQMPNLHLF